MNAIEEEIRRGESERLELKREIPKKDIQFLKTVVAFANGKGGRIVVGVDDATHEIMGVSCEWRSKLQDLITDMISNSCTPQIYPTYDWVEIQERPVLVVEIPESPSCPYYITREGAQGGTYVRVGATTRKADPEKVQELQIYGRQISYDSTVPVKTPPAKNEEIRTLCRLFNENKDESQRDVTTTQLLNWRFLTKGEKGYTPTVAFRLLVGHHSFHFSGVMCARFEGNSQTAFLDRKTFTGSLYEQYLNTLAFLRTHLRRATIIDDILRRDLYELPPTALREAVANALIHRNYLLHGMIKVSIFDDKVEISSPGTLYGNLSKEEMMAGISRLRNPLLADGFHRLKVVEKWGGGVKRIFELCKESGLPAPDYTIGDDSVTVTFQRPSPVRSESKPDSERGSSLPSSAIRQGIIKVLKKSPHASRKQLALTLNTSASNIQYHLQILRNEGVIERKGNTRSGQWIVRE